MKERFSEVPLHKQDNGGEQTALTPSELAQLDGMSREQLVALVRRMPGLDIALMTQEEIKDATRLRLAGIAIRNPDDKVALQAIQQLLDRLEGKASQSMVIRSETALTVDMVDYRAQVIAEADAMLLAASKRLLIEN